MQAAFFKESFPSNFEEMPGVLDRTVQAMRDRGYVSGENEACMRLCVEEALVNAVRHGNKCDERLQVTVELADEGDHCAIRVADEGEGFCPDNVQLPDTESLGGRGVCLIRHFMDKVCYNPAKKCLEMHVRKRTVAHKGE